jgi:hypothetical protein
MIVRRIPIRNVLTRDVKVHVEPWGEQHVLVSDELLELVFYGPTGGKPEIHAGEYEIYVYGWDESRVFVLKNNLCLSQPSLLKIIERLSASQKIDRSRLELERDMIDFAQFQLDKAESWDVAGREAAFTAVSKVAPLFRNLDNDKFVWAFCETVLHSRGMFLREDESKYNDFVQAFRDSRDFVAVLNNWHNESAMDPELVDSEKPG